MSFTLTYRHLSNPNFVPGLKKLVESDKWKEPKAAYNCSRLSSLIDIELKTFNDLRKKFSIRVIKAKPENDAEPTEADKALLEELKAEADKFADVTVTIERHKIDFKDLTEIPLTPLEILALEPLLDNLPS
jgi:hypothetical protein